MGRSIGFYSRAVLLLSIAQFAVSLSLSSRASAALAVSLGSLTLPLTAADDDATTAHDATDPLECKETDGTCNNNSESESDHSSGSDSGTKLAQANKRRTFGPNGDRLITPDEIALHIGNTADGGSPQIWLSILGKVYDVTTGPDFYGHEKGSYRFYAGRDASPCFSSGNNTPEGAAVNMLEWEAKVTTSILEWSQFYEDHETYQYLGILADSLYYDGAGNETELRKELISRATEAKRIMDEEREAKKKKRLAERMARKKVRE